MVSHGPMSLGKNVNWGLSISRRFNVMIHCCGNKRRGGAKKCLSQATHCSKLVEWGSSHYIGAMTRDFNQAHQTGSRPTCPAAFRGHQFTVIVGSKTGSVTSCFLRCSKFLIFFFQFMCWFYMSWWNVWIIFKMSNQSGYFLLQFGTYLLV